MPRSERKAVRQAPPDWPEWGDADLLELPIRSLGLHIQASDVWPAVQQLHRELADHELRFAPPCYLADEWFCPDKHPIIGIPFYLAHARLRRLERTMMYEVEGGTHEQCMRLLRHECGHAINYAFRLYTRTRWRELFGRFSDPYLNSYSSQPYSRRFVVHLPDNYAQSHPDEDFAETFAVWLTPGRDWRREYEDWPALRKLNYIDRTMAALRDTPPPVTATITPWSAARMTSSLAAFYERRRRALGPEFAGYYDGVLREVFHDATQAPEAPPAARFLRVHRRAIVDAVARWTNLRKFDVHELLRKLGRRCDALDLRTAGAEALVLIRATSLVTAIAGRALRRTDDGGRLP